MTEQARAIMISLAVHTLIGLTLIAANAGLAGAGAPLRLDLSMLSLAPGTARQGPAPARRHPGARALGGPALRRAVPREAPARGAAVLPDATEEPLAAAAGRTAPDGEGADASSEARVSPQEWARQRYMKEQFDAIRDSIHRRLTYPLMARRMGWTGRVTIAFIVEEDGGVDDVKVLAGSGHAALDRHAVETIRRGAPYSRPPGRAEFVMPITYRLDAAP